MPQGRTLNAGSADGKAFEARQLEAHEIRGVLNMRTQEGSFRRRPGSGPLARIGATSYGVPTGMGFHQCRAAYRTRFGGSPGWLDELHPYHGAMLCRLCLAENAALPEVYPVCPLT